MSSLEERVQAYAENLRSIAAQLEDIVTVVERANPDTNPGTDEIRGTIGLHRAVATDLDKIIADEPLASWAITGVLPGGD
ncbi:hypothetical protein [Microbacterium sp.]|uniref:hypothetical protein n=1 Tax=Microbacterium sp. TaxID=51671 RepID=UPI003F6F6068